MLTVELSEQYPSSIQVSKGGNWSSTSPWIRRLNAAMVMTSTPTVTRHPTALPMICMKQGRKFIQFKSVQSTPLLTSSHCPVVIGGKTTSPFMTSYISVRSKYEISSVMMLTRAGTVLSMQCSQVTVPLVVFEVRPFACASEWRDGEVAKVWPWARAIEWRDSTDWSLARGSAAAKRRRQ